MTIFTVEGPHLAGAAVMLGASLLAACARDPFPQSTLSQLVLESSIDLPGVQGRIDHLAIDVDHKKLFVAALGNGTVEVIDLGQGQTTGRIGGLHEPQGVGFLPDRNEVAIASGDGTLRFYDGVNLSMTGEIKLGDDADNVRIDPATGAVVVGYGGGALAIVNPETRTVSNTIALSAHPESFRLDPEGRRAFVNLPGAGQVAVADFATMKVTATYRASYAANYPMLYDAGTKSIAVIYRLPSRLVISDAADGRVRQDSEVCGDSDDMFLDERRQRIYVSCGSGDLDVFTASATGYYRSARIETRSGARTSLFVPQLDRLYVAARAGGGKPAAILVFRPE